MSRKHHRTSYSIHADDSSRDLRIFVSSLVIGICIGAFVLYFFGVRPHSMELDKLRADVATLSANAQSCTATRNAHATQRDEMESRLSSCTSTLSRLQHATQQNAQASQVAGNGPPLPKPPPGRTANANPVPEPLTPAPIAAVVANPIEPVPPAIVSDVATPLVWPKDWPPQPKVHPVRPVGSANPLAVEPIVAAAMVPTPPVIVSDVPAAVVPALTGNRNATLDVGQENTISGYKIRLIAVSRRTSGNYCVVGGNGISSQRIASGTTKRVSWNGHNVNIQAIVRDGDTCQIVLKPA